MSSWLVPFEMPSIAESPLMDVFPYFKDEEVNEEKKQKDLITRHKALITERIRSLLAFIPV